MLVSGSSLIKKMGFALVCSLDISVSSCSIGSDMEAIEFSYVRFLYYYQMKKKIPENSY